MPARTLKAAAHAALFLATFVAFYLGRGVGLRISRFWGTVLWGIAFALAC